VPRSTFFLVEQRFVSSFFLGGFPFFISSFMFRTFLPVDSYLLYWGLRRCVHSRFFVHTPSMPLKTPLCSGYMRWTPPGQFLSFFPSAFTLYYDSIGLSWYDRPGAAPDIALLVFFFGRFRIFFSLSAFCFDPDPSLYPFTLSNSHIGVFLPGASLPGLFRGFAEDAVAAAFFFFLAAGRFFLFCSHPVLRLFFPCGEDSTVSCLPSRARTDSSHWKDLLFF